MDDLAVLTPSFRGDAGLFIDLHESVLANTAPSVVHHVVTPPSDAHLFRQYEGARCRVWTHRDLLPRHCVSVPYASGLTLNLRRPWPPVRGWVVQQIMKMAGTAAIDARAVLVMDSDAVLLREVTLEQLLPSGRQWHFRRDHGVTAGMRRHLAWHRVAHELLGVEGSAAPPGPDYISPIAVWYPAVVRALMARIAECAGRDWIDAVASELHVSEFFLYGIFVDHVLGGVTPFDGPLCHNYYERIPLSRADARAFADEMPRDALGAMISSHSKTPIDVRRAAFRWCGQMVERSPWAPTHGRREQSIAARPGWPGWPHRCLDVAMMTMAQLPAVAPVGLV